MGTKKNKNELTEKCQLIKSYMLERKQYNYYVILSLYELSVGELNDILNLKKKDLTLTRGTSEHLLFLHNTKGCFVIEDDKLYNLLLRLIYPRTKGVYLFVDKNDNIIKQSSFSAFVTRAKKELGITDFVLKDIRYKIKIETLVEETYHESNSARRLLKYCELILNSVLEKKDEIGEQESKKLIEACKTIEDIVKSL
ncbi:hypothetical protein [Pseudobutyrivibrio sp. LB2011]|uniref:hypothetical protein n=1 Tax=Pseudobutyrivibrio sp. LB2011 TaxID=1408312 RepID=UPI0005D23625|nr:hypothetical protein [Pseudobutyrivibrio sp. LB2011]